MSSKVDVPILVHHLKMPGVSKMRAGINAARFRHLDVTERQAATDPAEAGLIDVDGIAGGVR